MGYRVNPKVATELERYGGETVNKCFNCGNCTAVCGLSREDTTFPRRYIRYMQLGMEDKMAESLEPWLCYYCGECSDTCPREAEPGELMMASRRWLTSLYDWTGLGRLMYRSAWAEVLALLILAAVVMALFMLPQNFGFKLLEATGGEALTSVNLEAFAPKHLVHYGDLIMAGLLFFFLLSNVLRMIKLVMKDCAVTIGDYIAEIPKFLIHLFTQKRWSECGNTGHAKHWIRHVFLVTGYATMFLLVVVFLLWFQIDDTSWHWTSLLGYYGTAVLLIVPGWMLVDRMRKQEAIHKYSHLSDWGFPALLFLTAITGILMHAFRLVDWAAGTYWIYMIHLMVAVPMLIVEVPFGKWSHLAYRPLAVYLQAVKERAESRQTVGQTTLVPQ